MVKGRGPTTKGAHAPKAWEPSPRDLEIYALLVSGKTSRSIAAQYKLSHVQITRIGKKIDKYLLPEKLEGARDALAFHIEAEMHIFRQAMESWELSKGDVVTVTEKKGEKPETITQRKANKVGNPAFLAQASTSMEKIRKMLGLDKAAANPLGDLPRAAGMEPDEAKKVYVEHQMQELRRLLEPSNN